MLVMGAVRLVRGATPHLRAAGGGSIVFIGSASVRNPPPQLLLSSVMRLGVAGLAKTLASSLAKDRIRVNVAAPGYFATGRVRRRIEAQQAEGATAQQAIREVAGSVPLGRIGRAEELAELVAFLVSDRCGFITGAHIPIDGGSTGYPL
jgi:3-oxoacyl-[acyl-carrier protein] reductase